jgi:prevent-host-death family protein
MKTIGSAKFKEQCLAILDDVDPEGIVITKRGKPVARLLPMDRPNPPNHGHLIGSMQGRSSSTRTMTCSRRAPGSPTSGGTSMLNLDGPGEAEWLDK